VVTAGDLLFLMHKRQRELRKLRISAKNKKTNLASLPTHAILELCGKAQKSKINKTKKR
jgi:anionic cell wall polymer biosynthesis LytR-Cps2A-Psr (LCP) family protein